MKLSDKVVELERRYELLNSEFNKGCAQSLNDRIEIGNIRGLLFDMRDRNLCVKLGRLWKKVSTYIRRRYNHIKWVLLYKRAFMNKLRKEHK